MKRILIYRPYGSDCTDEQERRILRKYPGCEFIIVWCEGAVMWQDAAKEAA